MSSDLEKSGERTETVEHKLDTLTASVDRRFEGVDDRFNKLAASVDERFDAVDAALVEQRQYTEFAFDRLQDEMMNGFNGVEGRFNGVEGRFNGVEGRFDDLEGRFDGLEGRFDSFEGRFERLERKLDQFIDTQSAANRLVERRLTALEPRSAEE